MKIKSQLLIYIFLFSLLISNISVLSIDSDQKNNLEINKYDDPAIKEVYFGGTDIEGSAVSTYDSQGNIIMACFSESFGIVGRNVLVTKYDINLNEIWTERWNTSDNAEPVGVIVDKNDNIFVAGTIITEFSPGNFIHDVFVLKYLPDGARDWNITNHIITEENTATCMTIDNENNLYVAGTRNGTIGTIFVQKYNSTSSDLIDTFYYGLLNEFLELGGIKVDNIGNIYLSASSDNSQPPANLIDIALIKLDKSGDEVWNQTFGGTGVSERGTDLAFSPPDIDGYYIYVVGMLESYVSNPLDAVLLKYDTNGNLLWNTTWNKGNDQGIAISINHNGNPVIIGTLEYPAANWGTFVAEFDDSGSLLWNETWNDDNVDYAQDIITFSNSTYGAMITVIQSYNDATSSFDIVLVLYEDSTYPTTQIFPTTGIGGKIAGYIIGIFIAIASIFVIVIIIFTFYRKKY